MISELKYIVCSYLNLEQILNLYRNKLSVRNKIISLYFKSLPDINREVRIQNLETVIYLHQSGVKLIADNLIQATANGNLKMVKYICEHISISKDILHISSNYACNGGYLEIIKYFLSIGFKPPFTTLQNACAGGHFELLKFLMQNGVKPTVDTINCASKYGKFEIVKFLISEGISPTPDTANKACIGGNLEIVKYLFQHEVEPSPDAIEFASTHGHLDIVNFLIERGYTVTSDAIDLACIGGYIEIIKILCKKRKPYYGALGIAIRNGHLETVKYLSQYFTITSTDINLAKEYEFFDIAEYLESEL